MKKVSKPEKISIAELDRNITYIKRKGFTHLKVELEGNLDRRDGDDEYCNECDSSGEVTCAECDYGENPCSYCDASGSIGEGDSAHDCDDCQGSGQLTCSACMGDYETICTECDGDGYTSVDGQSDDFCQEFIYSQLSQEARSSITFSEFYNDGSVDSEYTFTINIEAAHTLPEFINAFKRLSELTGQLDTERAGMHISVMTNGEMAGRPMLDDSKLSNFKRQMVKLMPALFFLASPDHKSRELDFRYPRVDDDKYSAIKIGTDHLEYRVFETCYQRPEAIFDNIAVIAKTLKYYGTPTLKTEFFKEYDFDRNKNYVGRFFETPEKRQILDKTLALLKPEYRSIESLKKERGIVSNKRKDARTATRQQIKYQEYCESQERRRQRELRDVIQRNRPRSARDGHDLYKVELNVPAFREYVREISDRLKQDYKPASFADWLSSDSSNGNAVKLYSNGQIENARNFW